ncbi:MAG TPA: PaaI family thioesterase [Candidatus Methylomirabilis sp.]|nr:PaaI family thioesterase [Candidatus Methylomirabilis sp.]
MERRAIQDQIRDNYCWGCGADNPTGLHLKSYWDGELAIAEWTPSEEFAAGPRHFLNGGIIATLLDCHGVCTAIADAYQRAGRGIGADPEIWLATTLLSVKYSRPTPITEVVELAAHLTDSDHRSAAVECVLRAGGKDRVSATVHATRVPAQWRHGSPESEPM